MAACVSLAAACPSKSQAGHAEPQSHLHKPRRTNCSAMAGSASAMPASSCQCKASPMRVSRESMS